ncbi:MAG TPA: glutamate ABC transporter substrate-binding protein [Kineosporiaceae bacterium]|nr:glutamate ABC transporter substrate-binding protein [Kineosporiaceae bacterium]
MRVRQSLPLTASAAVFALALAGCGGAANGTAQVESAARGPAPKAASVASTVCNDKQNQVASLAPEIANADPAKITTDPSSMTNSATLKQIRKNGYLTLGTSGDVLLWGATNPKSGELEGFDVDVAAEVAKAVGVDPAKTVYKVVNYGQRLSSLKEGSVDLVAHTMTINCARWQGANTPSAPNPINFSAEYYRAGQRVLVRSDSKAKEIEDLKGKKVCVPAASTNVDNMKALGFAEKDLIQLDVVGECLVMFQEGEADAITGDDTVLAGFAAQDTYAKVIGRKFSQEPYGLGINAEDVQFTRFVNAVLEKLRANGRLAQIYRQTMGKALPGTTLDVPEPVYGRIIGDLKRTS